MQIIDFLKLDCQRLNATMTEIGMADFSNLPFLTLVERLGMGSDRLTEESFPIQQCLGKINLSESIQQLHKDKEVADVIGPTKISKGAPVCFSTLLGTKPKAYLRQYIEVARILCKSSSGLRFIVWLEDTLTTLKNGWSVSTTRDSVEVYKAFFDREFPGCQIMISSEIAPAGVPQSFAEKFSAITTEEFLSALPFHLRNPMFVKTLDIVHFAWNCYLLHRLEGVHLGGINNKRHFQLFRKVVGQHITAILLPLGSENFAN